MEDKNRNKEKGQQIKNSNKHSCINPTISIFTLKVMLLLLLSRFSHVQLCATLYTAAPQAPVPGILQARTLEWAAVFFSNACMHTKSCVVSNFVQPFGQQPTRLLCPRDSPGKNTGVGCHFLLHGHPLKADCQSGSKSRPNYTLYTRKPL